MSSEGRPSELIVEDLSLMPSRRGAERTGEDLADCVEWLESLRNNVAPGAAKVTANLASAVWVGVARGEEKPSNRTASVCRR